MKFHYGILLAVLSLGAVVAQSNKIDAGLQKTLQRNGHAAILVTMKEGTKDILDKLNTMSFSSRVERYQAVYDALTSRARDSQEKVLRFLSTPSTSNKFRYANVTSFWITNQIGIQMASSAFVDRLVTMDGISKIEEEAIMHLVEPTELRKVSDDSPIVKDDNVWSVETVNAPKVWAKGYAGEGVRILVVDTGIRGTHEAFAKSFPNDEYSWYDATPQARSVPYDDNAHGTHVCGTAAGGYGIGVAPNSKIGACKALRADGSGTTADLLKCWQFAVCPRGNCNATYHIINNSWGNSQAYRGFDSGIETLKSFGVLSIFASGNDGPGCGSHGSPGDHPDVISVASTRSDNMVSDFSSRGPVATTRNAKPEVSCPGEEIISAFYTGDRDYAIGSGTSMASPSAAGVCALLLSINENLTPQAIRELLSKITNSAIPAHATCGGKAHDERPNYVTGYGLMDAYRGYEELYH